MMAIQPPYKGQPLRAAWAAEITAAVNALAPMGANGLLARQGLGGTGYAPLPENKRGRAASGLNPFVVRKVTASSSDATIPYTGYEIYLPTGCVSVGETCAPINPAAYRTVDGSRVDLPGWYRLNVPTGSDGDSFTVTVHAKCCAALSGIDTFTDWPKRYVWAEAHDTMTQAEKEAWVDDVGDTFSANVGTLDFSEDDDGNVVSTYTHGVKTPIMVRDTATTSQMALYYAFTVDATDLTLALDKIFVRNLVFSAAGASYIAASMTEIPTSREAVYLKIVTTTTPYTATIESYAALTGGQSSMTVPQQVESARQPGEIYLQLYALKNGHVTTNSLSSLQNIQLYQ